MLHFTHASCGRPLSWPSQVAPCRVLCYLARLISRLFSFFFSLVTFCWVSNSKLLTGNKRAGVICAKKAWPGREDQIDFAQKFPAGGGHVSLHPTCPRAHVHAGLPAPWSATKIGQKKLAQQILLCNGENGRGDGRTRGRQNSTPTHVCCGHATEDKVPFSPDGTEPTDEWTRYDRASPQSTVHSEAADRRCPPRLFVSLSSSLPADLRFQIGLLI